MTEEEQTKKTRTRRTTREKCAALRVQAQADVDRKRAARDKAKDALTLREDALAAAELELAELGMPIDPELIATVEETMAGKKVAV